MIKFCKSSLLIFLLGPAILSVSQEKNQYYNLETIIEGIAADAEEGSDVSTIVEDLQDLAENPLNLNDATEQDLRKLFFLNTLMINSLLSYREKYGQIFSLGELIAVENFTSEIIQKLTPFVKAVPPRTQPESWSDAFRYNDHQLLIRTSQVFQQSKGYSPRENGSAPYEGSPFRLFTRYKISNSRFSAGFAAEKDPGETFFRPSNRRGFDFYSFHTSFNVSRIIENITIGDYIIRNGQGLVAWLGYSPGKSAEVLGIAKTGQGIRPYTSNDENRFFRGIAATLNLNRINLQLFYSSKRSDANLVADDSAGIHFTSLQTSGYHRTISEIADEGSVSHTNAGTIASFGYQNFKIGAAVFYEKFGYPFIRTPQLYNVFYFNGTENLNLSADYQFNYRKLHLFGEAAHSKSGGNAFIQGLVAKPDDRAGFAFLYRHFDRSHQSIWGNAFSEGTPVANENGLYAGVEILPLKKVTFSAYSDFFRFPWATFSTVAPSSGRDIMIETDLKLSGKTLIYFRYKNEEKKMKTLENEKYTDIPERLQRYRLHVEFRPSSVIRMRSRIELASYSGKSRESGILFFQDILYTPAKLPLNVAFRAAWFNTDSYNSAIYAYENDVLYSFSIPAYYGKGYRFFCQFRYRLVKNLDFWLRVGHSVYTDQESIGSGNDQILGNQKTDVKFQFRLVI